MTERPRVVLDTNVYVSAFLSRSPTSPTREIFTRWRDGEFVLLVSDALVEEIIETLLQRGIGQGRISEFVTLLAALAEWVAVPPEAVERAVPADPDDDAILACALVGRADVLVTYDPHFDRLGGRYRGVEILKAVPFLRSLRTAAEGGPNLREGREEGRWCERGDSNPHGRNDHKILNLARLPIPPLSLRRGARQDAL